MSEGHGDSELRTEEQDDMRMKVTSIVSFSHAVSFYLGSCFFSGHRALPIFDFSMS